MGLQHYKDMRDRMVESRIPEPDDEEFDDEGDEDEEE